MGSKRNRKKKPKDVKKKAAAPPPPPPVTISGRRLWLFRIIAIAVIPVVLFLLVELTLRAAGYGYSAKAIVKCKLDGKSIYTGNPKFGWRFWPKNIAREFTGFVIPAEKSDKTYRIFVLGGSAALGTPDTAYSFSRFMEVMLRQQYPGVNFEVINTAITAINSHVVVDIAKGCAKYDGDLFVVYLGNNEIVGPYGAGTVFAPLSSSMNFIRFDKALKTFRSGQLLTDILKSMGQGKDIPKVWGGSKMFMENLIRRQSHDLQTVYDHYQRNMEDIRDIAIESGAKIIFSTVGSNLKDCPPFASLHREGLTQSEKEKWEGVYERGIASETQGQHAKAIEHYLAAGAIDDSYAELQFRLGRCYQAMANLDNLDKAKERYTLSRESDTLRLRADSRLNDIVRDVAGGRMDEGVLLADAVKAIEADSPNGIPGEELFFEHVHFKFNGNYLLAKTILEQAEQIFPDWVKIRKANKPLINVTECYRRLAFTDWDRHYVLNYLLNAFVKKPPFTSQLDNPQVVEQMSKEVMARKLLLTPQSLERSADQYREAIEMWPSDWQLRWKYAKLLMGDLKDYMAAAEQFRMVNKCVPNSYFGHTGLGISLAALADHPVAIASFEEAIRIKPAHFEAYHKLALLYKNLDRTDEAMEYYSKTLRVHPGHAPARIDLGNMLYRQGKVSQAEQIFREGLLFSPKSFDMRLFLSQILEKQERYPEAAEQLRTILQMDPGSEKIRLKLDELLKKTSSSK